MTNFTSSESIYVSNKNENKWHSIRKIYDLQRETRRDQTKKGFIDFTDHWVWFFFSNI